jgi:hypothetical protein
VGSGGVEAARLLVDRLGREHPEWCRRLRVEEAVGEQVVKGDVPGRAGHELSVVLSDAEATVAYRDGLPPGPAEKLFIWGDAPASEGIEAVVRFVDDLIRGETVLVRERIPALARLLRRDGAESLLRFVTVAELADWPPRKRRAVDRVWAWDPDRKPPV